MLKDNAGMKIGKYKGKMLKDIPESYLKELYVSLHGSICEQLYIQELKEWIDNKYSFSKIVSKHSEEKEYIDIINKSCPKERFISEEEAKNRLRQIKKEGEKIKEKRIHYKYPIRAYYCPKCGFYHLTSQPKLNDKFSDQENNDNEITIDYNFQHKNEWLKLLNKE